MDEPDALTIERGGITFSVPAPPDGFAITERDVLVAFMLDGERDFLPTVWIGNAVPNEGHCVDRGQLDGGEGLLRVALIVWRSSNMVIAVLDDVDSKGVDHG